MNRNLTSKVALFTFGAAILATTTIASADDDKAMYKITITNLTRGQPITPLLATTHRSGMSFFQAGEAPSAELATLAESGNGKPLAAKLLTMSNVSDAKVGNGVTLPGKSNTMMITARSGRDHLSVGAMLGNTNDGFAGLRDVALPKSDAPVTYMIDGYDAGSEANDELCATVPGPACGGAALSPDDAGEGYVHIHGGIHGIGGLMASEYDWRNPVAQIVIERIEN